MKKVLIFGGSGQCGLHLIRKLTKRNHLVTVVTRNLHKKGIILKTQGNPGYVEVVEANVFNENELNRLFENKDICINLVGILFEKKNNTFKNIHVNFPTMLSQKCEKYNIKKLIHVSALGIEKSLDSKYAISKLEGEKNIINNFSNLNILRPSVVFSVDDNFTTNLMTLLNLLPIFPLYYGGKTKFCPLHVSDFCDIILKVIEENISDKIIECVGPEEISFREIIEKLLISIEKKRTLIRIPIKVANFIAYFFEKFPSPLITRDQIKLLKYDNVLSGEFKSNIDLGFKAKLKFEDEIKKYSYMWKKGGQYSK
tara:strand:+ start:12 stop:947 length:936 start_codon:yes stop_codon:yes gene_type:complete